MFCSTIVKRMIVCASRRTDIPAFHSKWMINRLRAGYALTRNPVCKEIVYRVDLTPRNVDMMIFMSKDPRPMVKHLDEISDMGIRFCFQITITPYGKEIEPGVPFKADVADCFKEISDKIGKGLMTWRYDPLILNDRYDIDYHRRKFEVLCNELRGYTERCVFGFADIHKKLEGLEKSGMLRNVTTEEIIDMGRTMSHIASDNGIKLNLCCSDTDLSEFDITSKGCIDKDYLAHLNVPIEMSAPLREGCKCVKSVDIGHYDTCGHDCIYCYANQADDAKRKKRTYDPGSEMLFGKVGADDKVIELDLRRILRISDF